MVETKSSFYFFSNCKDMEFIVLVKLKFFGGNREIIWYPFWLESQQTTITTATIAVIKHLGCVTFWFVEFGFIVIPSNYLTTAMVSNAGSNFVNTGGSTTNSTAGSDFKITILLI